MLRVGVTNSVVYCVRHLGMCVYLGRHICNSSCCAALFAKVKGFFTPFFLFNCWAIKFNFYSCSFCLNSHRNWFIRWVTGSSVQTVNDDYELGSDDEDDDDKKDEEKKTIKERLQAIQEVSQTVQNTIGYLASLGESVKKWVVDFHAHWKFHYCSPMYY